MHVYEKYSEILYQIRGYLSCCCHAVCSCQASRHLSVVVLRRSASNVRRGTQAAGGRPTIGQADSETSSHP